MAKKTDVDVNSRALDFIYELIGRNPAHFQPVLNGEYRTELWGKKDGEYIYIIKSVFDREMSLGGFNSASFLSWAKRRNLLKCDKDGRRTFKAKVGNSIVNTVCLARSFEEIRDAEPSEGQQEGF